MRKVRQAPKYSVLLEKYSKDPERLIELWKFKDRSIDTYDHWDKLQHKTPPNELDNEQWWFIIKSGRINSRMLLPLHDKNNIPFSYVLTDKISRTLHQIEVKARTLVEVDAKFLNSTVRDRYLISSLIEEAITSSQLEGASTTRNIARSMLRSGRKPRDKHEQMILNNFLAMKSIVDRSSNKLTTEEVLALHEIVTEDTMHNPHDSGRFQDENEQRVTVGDEFGSVFHNPPKATEIPVRMEQMVEFSNQSAESSSPFVHPIVKAIILHFMLGYVHPFVDGNGRVARALFYRALNESGYSMFSFISISQVLKKAPAKYGYAFQYVETDEGDLTYFIHHQLGIITKALANLESYVQKKQRQIALIDNELRRIPMNYRQLALLSHAIRHRSHVYSIRSHQMSHRCAYATARADLLQLTERGFLTQIPLDRKTMGFVTADEIEKLVDYRK